MRLIQPDTEDEDDIKIIDIDNDKNTKNNKSAGCNRVFPSPDQQRAVSQVAEDDEIEIVGGSKLTFKSEKLLDDYVTRLVNMRCHKRTDRMRHYRCAFAVHRSQALAEAKPCKRRLRARWVVEDKWTVETTGQHNHPEGRTYEETREYFLTQVQKAKSAANVPSERKGSTSSTAKARNLEAISQNACSSKDHKRPRVDSPEVPLSQIDPPASVSMTTKLSAKSNTMVSHNHKVQRTAAAPTAVDAEKITTILSLQLEISAVTNHPDCTRIASWLYECGIQSIDFFKTPACPEIWPELLNSTEKQRAGLSLIESCGLCCHSDAHAHKGSLS